MSKPRKRKLLTFVANFGLLAAVDGANTIVGWFHSNDMKGLWPVALTVHLIISLLYSQWFTLLIHQVAAPVKLKSTLVYNSILVLLILLLNAAFYGILPFHELDKIAHRPSTFVLLYPIFLLPPALMAISSKVAARRSRPQTTRTS